MVKAINTKTGGIVEGNDSWWQGIQKQMSRDPGKHNRRVWHKDGSPVWVLEGTQEGTVPVQEEKKSVAVRSAGHEGTLKLSDDHVDQLIGLARSEEILNKLKAKMSPDQLERFATRLIEQAAIFKASIEKGKEDTKEVAPKVKAENPKATKPKDKKETKK